ncbi:MAG: hypothetical protein ACMG6E_10750, partial [Candidatus Roizmanbacteria bacterium]
PKPQNPTINDLSLRSLTKLFFNVFATLIKNKLNIIYTMFFKDEDDNIELNKLTTQFSFGGDPKLEQEDTQNSSSKDSNDGGDSRKKSQQASNGKAFNPFKVDF